MFTDDEPPSFSSIERVPKKKVKGSDAEPPSYFAFIKRFNKRANPQKEADETRMREAKCCIQICILAISVIIGLVLPIVIMCLGAYEFVKKPCQRSMSIVSIVLGIAIFLLFMVSASIALGLKLKKSTTEAKSRRKRAVILCFVVLALLSVIICVASIEVYQIPLESIDCLSNEILFWYTSSVWGILAVILLVFAVFKLSSCFNKCVNK